MFAGSKSTVHELLWARVISAQLQVCPEECCHLYSPLGLSCVREFEAMVGLSIRLVKGWPGPSWQKPRRIAMSSMREPYCTLCSFRRAFPAYPRLGQADCTLAAQNFSVISSPLNPSTARFYEVPEVNAGGIAAMVDFVNEARGNCSSST